MSNRLDTEIHVHSLTDGTATVAQVVVHTDEFDFQGRGHSNRMPGDANDPELGEIIAVLRALENVTESMRAKARRIILVNDKKRDEAANYKTLADWTNEQEAARLKSMEAHPAGSGTETAALPVTDIKEDSWFSPQVMK